MLPTDHLDQADRRPAVIDTPLGTLGFSVVLGSDALPAKPDTLWCLPNGSYLHRWRHRSATVDLLMTRVQAALDAEWPFAEELFSPADASLTGVVADPATLRVGVLADVRRVVAEATLAMPDVAPALGGGRQGMHTEHLGFLLAEMQHLHRSHPGATW